MKRLIYAPKAYVFIRSSNQNGRIYDVSSDVVSGSVTQNVGDLSKAEFVLRNRYQKWIRDPDNKESVFLPMDLVTIWLQRVAGRPIQVFTGYLDSVPYYQGYPGDATFTASCTLKKLAYTWFDPGLEFFNQWVTSTGGWTYDITTGEAQNIGYNLGNVDVGKDIDTRDIHDGGFAELLGRFMLEIAGWGPNDVLISELPKDLPKIAGELYNNIHDPVGADLEALSEFLGQAMGVPGYSVATDSTSDLTADGKQAQNNAGVALATSMDKIAGDNNIPSLVVAFAAHILTNLKARWSYDSDKGEWYGYGLYAMRPDAHDRGDSSVLIEGLTKEQILSADAATQAFCRKLRSVQTDNLVKAARNSDVKKIVEWVVKASGRPLRNSPGVDTAFESAKTFIAQAVVVTPKTTPTSVVLIEGLSWIDPRVHNLTKDTTELKIMNEYADRLVEPWMCGWYYRAKKLSPQIEIARPVHLAHKNNTTITLYCSRADRLLALWNNIKSDPLIDWAAINVSDRNEIVVKGVAKTATQITGAPVRQNTIVINQKTAPPKGTTTGGAGAEATDNTSAADASSTPTGGATFEQLAAFSANAAFAANFAFPSNRIESTFLTGDRALMNDVSCFDGMKQFCQGSMRTFRSLPDGRFLAFYPDYFGAYRKPYWQIRDIEIVNMGIQLNDEALATHVYVTGDTFALDGQIDWIDRASTRGVATITQAMMLDSIMMPYNPDKTGDENRIHRLKDAWEFLQHYGARPHAEEQPLIRNTAYEFLMAWQRFGQLWASTFATTVDFTFQPEVMAGGLIEFPDHDLQMYCENVTHTWSYESGFTTQATMSSPSHTATKNDRTSMPGFAMAGGINSVGAG